MNQESTSGATPPIIKKDRRAFPAIIALASIIALIFVGVIYVLIFNVVSKSNIEVADQPLSDKIMVKKAVIKKGGFVVVYARGRFGAPGARIAQTEYLIPDTYTDFSLNLLPTYQFEGMQQLIELQPGDKMTAIVYEDTNGDQRPDPATDKPARDLFGNLISASFVIE